MFIINPYVFAGLTGYIVQDYSPVAAYSLRKLSSSATNAIRVRRSSDSSEQDIGFSGDDLDTASLSSFVGANSAYVVKWYNQGTGGASIDLTQSTAANQPRIVNAGTIDTKGGFPCMVFDGSNDRLEYSTGVFNGVDISFFSVTSMTSANTFGYIAALADSASPTLEIFRDATTTLSKRHFEITNTTPTLYQAGLSAFRNNTNQILLSSFVDASKNMSAFDNGATGGTATYTGSFVSNAVVIGGRYNRISGLFEYPINGTAQEFIGFNTNETSNRTDIESNINGYYNLYYGVYSMNFDGVNEYFSAGRVLATESAANFSISCWCYFDGLRAAGDHPIGKYLSSTNSMFLQILSDGKLVFNVSNGAQQRGLTIAGAITSGSWIHIVATYDGAGATNPDKYKVYINGANYTLSGFNAGSGPATTSTDTGNLLLGKAGTGAAAYMDGKLDEMAFFDYTLSSTQVTSLYNSGKPTDLNSTTGVTAPTNWWRMGDNATWGGSSWTVDDEQGLNDATSVNMEEADRVIDVP